MNRRISVIVFLAVSIFSLSSCSSDGTGNNEGDPNNPSSDATDVAQTDEGTGAAVEFSIIESGFDGSVGVSDERRVQIFRDQNSLNNASSLANFGISTPSLTFENQQVVFLTMGLRSNGGFSITAESVEDFGDYIRLNVVLTAPGSGCVTTSILTHPNVLLEINSAKELVLSERFVVESCGS